MVSAVPNSPDCTTKASRPAARHNKTIGSANQRRRRKFIVWMVIQRAVGPQTWDFGLLPTDPLLLQNGESNDYQSPIGLLLSVTCPPCGDPRAFVIAPDM